MTKRQANAKTVVVLLLLVIYLVLLFQLTLARGYRQGIRGVNLTPFATIAEYLQSIARGHSVSGMMNLFGNLVLLMPLGYMSAELFPNMRKTMRVLILALSVSLAIESLQWILARGSADIDDLILNALGGVLSYWIYLIMQRWIALKKYAVGISMVMITLAFVGYLSVGNYRFLLPSPGRLQALPEPAGTTSIGHDDSAWSLILINKWNVIPQGYSIELTELKNGQSVDSRIYPALQEMFDAARSAGVYPVVASGYRTSHLQQQMMDEKIAEYRAAGYTYEDAAAKAEEWVARPGASEHQIGIAIDINADGVHSTGDQVYAWLNDNSHRYGFIRRYPAGKSAVTGVMHEPWHYRYVGVDAATEMSRLGLCLEEYLDASFTSRGGQTLP